MPKSLRTKSGPLSWRVCVSLVSLNVDPNQPPPDLSSAPTKETKGHRKVLASADINLQRFAGPAPVQTHLALALKPLSAKVVEATLKLSLSCVLVREGKAT